MKTVDIHEAEMNLSRLLQEANDGDEIIIAKAGKPLAKLVRYDMPDAPRKPGSWRGQVWMAHDFDETPENIIVDFYGEES